jgi:DNA repair protein RadC
VARPLELPRERLYRRGVAALADAELLAVLVGPQRVRGGRASTAERSLAVDRARESSSVDATAAGSAEARFAAVGSLADLARASPHELARVAGVGRVHAARLAAAFELGRRAIEVAQHRRVIQGPADVLALLGPRVTGLRQELFFAIGLDVRHHVLDIVEVARGTATEVGVHPREVFRPLIRAAAVCAVVAHNHPSGDPTPSLDDIELTRRLCAVGKIVGIPVLDHVVIGGNEMRSIIEGIGEP